MTDLVGSIIAHETGTLSARDTVKFFGELIKNGMAWTLQGSYGRAAANLIEQGLISQAGEVQWDKVEDRLDE